MIDIPLPRLIDNSGNTIRTVRPLSVSLNLNIVPLSYASIDLPRGENLPARGYVELFNSMGSAGIFRVRSPQDAYGEDVTTAELEHAIVEVGDFLVLAEYDQMMDAKTAMTTVFSHYRGSKWRLGTVDVLAGKTIALDAKYVRVLEAMLAILDQCRNCMMTFDFSTTPWTVNVVSRGTIVAAEGRLSRNVNSAKVIYDDTELCTRVYYEVPSTMDVDTKNYPTFDASVNYSVGSIVAKDSKLYQLTAAHKSGVAWEDTSKKVINDNSTTVWKHMDSDTLAEYGLIEKDISIGNDYTEAECDTVARDYLERNKRPMVSVEISAEELSNVTHEPFDTFTIGKLCRLALVDFNTTVERVITAVSWNNVYDDPLNVTLTLADDEYTSVTFLHDLDTSGGSSGRGGGGGRGKKNTEKEWKEFYTKMEQDDKHIELMAIRQDESERILQQAGLYLDSSGVIQYARDNEKMIASSIKTQADRIDLVVQGTGKNATINAASIILAINGGSGSSVSISADKIDIDGLITSLEAKDVQFNGFNAYTGEFTGTLTVQNGFTNYGTTLVNGLSCTSLDVDGTGFSERSLKVNNVEKAKFLGTADVNFDRAAAYNEGWHDAAAGSGRVGNTVTYPSSTVGQFVGETASITGDSYTKSRIQVAGSDISTTHYGPATVRVEYWASSHSAGSINWRTNTST